MPASPDFFVNGVDFSVQNEITASLLNSSVNDARTASDKGIIIRTQDTAVGVPDEPDVAGNAEFAKHLWLRIKHASDPVQDPILYCYDALTSTWITLLVNVSALTAAIAAADAKGQAALDGNVIQNGQISALSTNVNSLNADVATLKTKLGVTIWTRSVVTLNQNGVGGETVANPFLPYYPDILRAEIVCNTAYGTYLVGDRISFTFIGSNDTTNLSLPVAELSIVGGYIRALVRWHTTALMTIPQTGIGTTLLAIANADRPKWTVKLTAIRFA